jgi:hypothetical protein
VTVTGGDAVNVLDFSFIRPTGIVRIGRARAAATGSFSGVVLDGQSVALPVVTLILTNTQTQSRFITCTDRTGTFEFTGLPAGEFALEAFSAAATSENFRSMSSPQPVGGGSYESVTGSVTIRPSEDLHAELRMRRLAPLPAAAQNRPDLYATLTRSSYDGVAGGGPLRNVQEPTLPYPASVKDYEASSAVDLQVLIGKGDGKPLWVRVVSPDAHPALARVALQEVISWTFRLLVLNSGEVMNTLGTITVYFTR